MLAVTFASEIGMQNFQHFLPEYPPYIFYRWNSTSKLSYHILNGLSCHSIDKYQKIKLMRYHDPIKRRRHNRFYRESKLKFKMATAYLSLVQPSESTAWCRMISAGARGALSPPRRPSPAPQPFLQPWPCQCLAVISRIAPGVLARFKTIYRLKLSFKRLSRRLFHDKSRIIAEVVIENSLHTIY